MKKDVVSLQDPTRTDRMLRTLGVPTAYLLLALSPLSAQLIPGDTRSIDPPLMGPIQQDHDFGEEVVWLDANGDGSQDLVSYHREGSLFYVDLYLRSGSEFELWTKQLTFSVRPVLAACDFDPSLTGDELIVGLETFAGVGAVFVVNLNSLASTTFTQTDAGAIPESGDLFGGALAVGDFDSDDTCDIAIGSSGEDIGGAQAGSVLVRYGPLNAGSWSAEIHQGTPGVPGNNEDGDKFGQQLAAGNLDGVFGDDLVVGTPGEDYATKVDLGAVRVIYGNGSGLDVGTTVEVLHATLGQTTTLADGDSLGSVLATGDLNRDGIDDLVVGIPSRDYLVPFREPGSYDEEGVSSDPLRDAETRGIVLPNVGFVGILYGGPSGFEASPTMIDESDVGLTPVSNDRFGSAITVGNIYGGWAADLIVAARNRNNSDGEVHVFRGGPNGPRYVSSFDETDLPDEDSDREGFGFALAIGDIQGDGTVELAIGVPNEAVEISTGRGSLPGEGVGRVHVVPARSLLREAEVIAMVGSPYLTDPFAVIDLSPPSSNASGDAAWRLRNQDPEDWVVTLVRRENGRSEIGKQVGIDAFGRVAWIDLEAVHIQAGDRRMYFEGTPAPGGGLWNVSSADQLQFRGDQQIFLMTKLDAPTQEVLVTENVFSGGFSRLLEDGQSIGPSTVGPLLRFSASPNANHWIATTEFVGGQGIVVDGGVLYDPTGDFEDQYYPDVAVGDEGNWAVVEHVFVPPTDGSVIAAPLTELTPDLIVANVELGGLLPGNVVVSSNNTVLSVWFDLQIQRQMLIAFCADPDTSAGFVPPLRTERVLTSGDRLDTDDDGSADATLRLLNSAPGATTEMSNAGELLVHVGITFDSDPQSVKLALLRVSVGGCPMFSDGFESGDTNAWN